MQLVRRWMGAAGVATGVLATGPAACVRHSGEEHGRAVAEGDAGNRRRQAARQRVIVG